MKIGEYEQMMSYLTRPGFNGGSGKKPTTIEELKKSGKITTADKVDRPDKAKLLQAIRDFELRNPRKNKSEGGPMVPEPKPLTEEIFKENADRFIKGALGGFPKDEMITKLQEQLDKVQESGTFSKEQAINFINERTKQLREFIKQNPGETLPGLDRVNKAIGGEVIEGEDLGTREGFSEPKKNLELDRAKGILGKLNYNFDSLLGDLKKGKTTNQIANELYENNKKFLDKYDAGRIQKLNPIVLVEQSLKDRIRKQPNFVKLNNKNQKVFNSKKEQALKDFNSFIKKNKSKYKKMYDQNIAGAPEKFKQDLKSFLEKKYPEFIKESGGGTYITKGTKLFTPIKDLGREITQAGDYGIEKYINNTIKESLDIPLRPKAGEGSSLDRMQRKYNLSTRQLLDVAKKQGIIPEKDPITGNPINSEDAYYRYVKRTEVDPIYNLFDKRFKFGAEHLGGISRAANIGDPEALTKMTAIDPYVNRVLKGSNLDKKVSTQINLAKETGNKKYLNIANDLIKQGEKDFGLKLTKYKFKDNKIVPVHPKVSMNDPIMKKAERAIKSFVATGRDKTKEFQLLPEDLKQSIQLFKENNLPKARKFLNQAIKTGNRSERGFIDPKLLGADKLAKAITLYGPAAGKIAQTTLKGASGVVPFETLLMGDMQQRGLSPKEMALDIGTVGLGTIFKDIKEKADYVKSKGLGDELQSAFRKQTVAQQARPTLGGTEGMFKEPTLTDDEQRALNIYNLDAQNIIDMRRAYQAGEYEKTDEAFGYEDPIMRGGAMDGGIMKLGFKIKKGE